MIPRVRQWLIRCNGARWIVLAPTRRLAVLNLRAAGIYGDIVTAAAVRNPRDVAATVTRDPLDPAR